MPLIDVQRRLAEVGRIRLGEKGAKGQPVKRETWRLTSRDRNRLVAAQTIYPGELRPWNEQHELLTETDELAVMVLPGQTLSQWYELWTGGGCQRRCDGERMTDDQPCMCPVDPIERAELAKTGKACKATTRLSVMLPDVPGVGMWRLESHGYYAASELAGMAELLQHVTALGIMLPARLRIDQRTSVKGGQTRRYPVPVIDLEATPNEVRSLTSGGSDEHKALPAAPLSAGPRALGTDGDQSEQPQQGDDVDRDTRTSGAEATADPAIDVVPLIAESQRRFLFAEARDAGLGEDGLRAVVLDVTGQSSTAAIPLDKFDDVKAAILAAAGGGKLA